MRPRKADEKDGEAGGDDEHECHLERARSEHEQRDQRDRRSGHDMSPVLTSRRRASRRYG